MSNSGYLRFLPNGLTCLRLVIAAAFPFSPEDVHLLLIAVGLLTEFLDGFLARLFHVTSYLGRVLDPIADKLFVLSVSLTWVWLGKLSPLEWLLVAIRDFGVLFIFLALILLGRIGKVRSLSARMPSKITTVFQYMVFFAVLLEMREFMQPLVIATAVLGIIATAHYAFLLRHELTGGVSRQGDTKV